MAFHLRKSPIHLSNSIASNGGQIASRGRGVQGKQVSGSSVPVYFLLNSFNYSSFHRTHCQIPFILPHTSSLPPFQKGLPLVYPHKSVVCIKPEVSLCYLNKFRLFCKYVDSSDGEKEPFVVDNAKLEAEVERVCKLIDETFSLDRNMEAVLDECGINLNHDLVLGVLRRFKHARKPAFRFFCWASEIPGFAHDSRSYNAMMDILGKNRQFETMISVLEEMGEKGLLSLETFSICIKSFVAAKERRKAVGVFDLMKKHKFKISAETMSCLLDALGRAKLGKEARVLFERFKHKFTPDITTYTVLLNGCCEVRDLLEAGRVWNEMIDRGFTPDIVAHNVMLEGLLRGGKRIDAIKLFEVMKSRGPFPNVRSYTILINHLCKQGNMEEAMNYLDDMLDAGIEPDAAVYTCLMIGFGNQKNMYMVHLLLKQMKEKGCSPDGLTYNALIKMMVNRKMPDDAVKVYKKMIQSKIEPSIHTYNMIMKAYFIARNYEMGCAVWEEMKRKGRCPDENSYIVFIGGLVRQRKMNEALKYLKEMNDKGMKAPDFSKADGWNTLENFAQEMKFSGNFEVSNLFAGCLRR